MYAKEFYGFLILEFFVFLELEVLRNSSTQETISHVINKFIWEIKFKDIIITVFENRPKSRIQYCERSELRLHFEWTKVNKKCQKWSWILWSNSVTRQSLLKLDKNWCKIPKLRKMRHLSNFLNTVIIPKYNEKFSPKGKSSTKE